MPRAGRRCLTAGKDPAAGSGRRVFLGAGMAGAASEIHRGGDAADRAVGGPAKGGGGNAGFLPADGAEEAVLPGAGGGLRCAEEGKKLLRCVKIHDVPRRCPHDGGELAPPEPMAACRCGRTGPFKKVILSIMARLFKKSRRTWKPWGIFGNFRIVSAFPPRMSGNLKSKEATQ